MVSWVNPPARAKFTVFVLLWKRSVVLKDFVSEPKVSRIFVHFCISWWKGEHGSYMVMESYW